MTVTAHSQDRTNRGTRYGLAGPGEPWDAAAWDRFVEQAPSATLYHRSVFRGIVEDVFGHRTYYLQECGPAGEITGVLPLVRLTSRLFGDFLVSMPFFNYGGAVGDDPAVESSLMRRAADLAADLGVSHVEFRDSAPREGSWPVRADKVAMKLQLPESEEALWKQIGPKLRAQVRRPSKEGEAVTVEHGGVELLEDFYRVFSRNMRDLGTPVYSDMLFRTILDRLGSAAHIVLVRVADRPAAAGFLLRHRENMEIPWASSLREFNGIGVNMLLYWEALRFSIEQGCRVFDFGRSSVDSGTYRFKRQWGAEPRQLYWHYWLSGGGELPELNPNNPKFRLAIQVWRKLPLAVANRLGPPIVRNLP
jgi:serine/alanine adding enzyme